MEIAKAAEGFSLLADPNRLIILRNLGRGGEQNAGQLLGGLSISQPTLSHHMKVLCGGGLVRRRRHGQRILYSLNREALLRLLATPLGEGEEAREPAGVPAGGGERQGGVIVCHGHKR